MALKDRIKKLERVAAVEAITVHLRDGSTAKFRKEELFPECFLHQAARWRRNHAGEDPGPAHPFTEALRQALGEDMVMRGERERRGPPALGK